MTPNKFYDKYWEVLSLVIVLQYNALGPIVTSTPSSSAAVLAESHEMELSHSFPIPGRMQLGNGTYRPWLCIFHIRAQVSTLSLLCLYFVSTLKYLVTVMSPCCCRAGLFHASCVRKTMAKVTPAPRACRASNHRMLQPPKLLVYWIISVTFWYEKKRLFCVLNCCFN